MMKRLINLMPFLASFIGVVCAASLGSAQGTIPQELSPELAMYNSIEEGRRAWLKTRSFLKLHVHRARGSYQKRKNELSRGPSFWRLGAYR